MTYRQVELKGHPSGLDSGFDSGEDVEVAKGEMMLETAMANNPRRRATWRLASVAAGLFLAVLLVASALAPLPQRGASKCEGGSCGSDANSLDATLQLESKTSPKHTEKVSSGSVTTYKLGVGSYSPYAFTDQPTHELTGFGVNMARGLADICDDIAIEIVETPWNDCWRYDDSGIGDALEQGTVDACATYTHTHGLRNEYADFGWAILKQNKAAGLLARLENGMPTVSSDSDLSDVTVVDVAGWAPTPDTLGMTTNKCTDKGYPPNISIISRAGNNAALEALMDKEADVLYIYSDQPKNIKNQCAAGQADVTVNCDLWNGFGKDFAFVQTGKFGWVQNGTTLIMTKKGSGVDAALNGCVAKFMESSAYHDLCLKYPTLFDDCYPNSFFTPDDDKEVKKYNTATDELDGCCGTGYCPCDQSQECHEVGQ